MFIAWLTNNHIFSFQVANKVLPCTAQCECFKNFNGTHSV